MNTSLWQPYFISIAIGLLVGIEREKAQHAGKTMGVRTFVLMGMLGAVAGGLDNLWLAGLISAFCFSLICISYFTVTFPKSSPGNHGLTTEFAAAIVFCLGLISHIQPMLTSLLGAVVALVLVSKKALHHFTDRLKPDEIQAAVLLLLFGVSVLNLLEDRVVDPWGIFNPYRFGLLILILASLEFGSYALTKMLGEKSGALAIGFFGGMVSSTAVLLSSARQALKSPKSWRRLLGTTVAANVSSFGLLLFIIGIISSSLLSQILIPVGSAMAMGLIGLFLVMIRTPKSHSEIELRSPLDWRGVIRLALLLGGILASVAGVKRWLGDEATVIVSTLTAMFELQGVSMANATIFKRGQLPMQAAIDSILWASTASLAAKIAMSWVVNRGPFTRTLTAIYLLMAVALWSSILVL